MHMHIHVHTQVHTHLHIYWEPPEIKDLLEKLRIALEEWEIIIWKGE